MGNSGHGLWDTSWAEAASLHHRPGIKYVKAEMEIWNGGNGANKGSCLSEEQVKSFIRKRKKGDVGSPCGELKTCRNNTEHTIKHDKKMQNYKNMC